MADSEARRAAKRKWRLDNPDKSGWASTNRKDKRDRAGYIRPCRARKQAEAALHGRAAGTVEDEKAELLQAWEERLKEEQALLEARKTEFSKLQDGVLAEARADAAASSSRGRKKGPLFADPTPLCAPPAQPQLAAGSAAPPAARDVLLPQMGRHAWRVAAAANAARRLQ